MTEQTVEALEVEVVEKDAALALFGPAVRSERRQLQAATLDWLDLRREWQRCFEAWLGDTASSHKTLSAYSRAWNDLWIFLSVPSDGMSSVADLWWQLWLVIALSSVGIIIRSLLNEKREADPALNRYKTKWAMEAVVDDCGAIIGLLEKALGVDSESKRVRLISEALSAAHKASREITFARYGEPEKK